MKILVTDVFDKGQTFIVEPGNVPRIGDRIMLDYLPAPIVTDVIWDFNKKSGNDVLIRVE